MQRRKGQGVKLARDASMRKRRLPSFLINCYLFFFFFYSYDAHRHLHGTKHSFPTRRSSDLPLGYDSERVVTMNVALNPALYAPGSRRDRKSTRLNSSHFVPSRMPSSA